MAAPLRWVFEARAPRGATALGSAAEAFAFWAKIFTGIGDGALSSARPALIRMSFVASAARTGYA